MLDSLRKCERCVLAQYRRFSFGVDSYIPAWVPEPQVKNVNCLFITDNIDTGEEVINMVLAGHKKSLFDFLIFRVNSKLSYYSIDFQVKPYVTSMLGCRPTDKKFGNTRAPKKDEVFACTSNLIKEVESLKNIQFTFFFGKEVFNYYAREFPDALELYSLFVLAKAGTIGSGYFALTIRKIFDKIQAEKNR